MCWQETAWPNRLAIKNSTRCRVTAPKNESLKHLEELRRPNAHAIALVHYADESRLLAIGGTMRTKYTDPTPDS